MQNFALFHNIAGTRQSVKIRLATFALQTARIYLASRCKQALNILCSRKVDLKVNARTGFPENKKKLSVEQKKNFVSLVRLSMSKSL